MILEADGPELNANDRLNTLLQTSGAWCSSDERATRQMVMAHSSFLSISQKFEVRSQFAETFTNIIKASQESEEFSQLDVEAQVPFVPSSYFVSVGRWATDTQLSIQAIFNKQFELLIKALR